jgi:hypothetical protein
MLFPLAGLFVTSEKPLGILIWEKESNEISSNKKVKVDFILIVFY